MPWDPDHWSSQEWKKHDAALARLLNRADNFVRDLDATGWMIVAQNGGTERWPMNSPGACPSWAEPYEANCRPKPALSSADAND